jgi:hypothetical protein
VSLSIYCHLPYMISARIVSLSIYCHLAYIILCSYSVAVPIFSFTEHDQWSYCVAVYILSFTVHYLELVYYHWLYIVIYRTWSVIVFVAVYIFWFIVHYLDLVYYHWHVYCHLPYMMSARIVSLSIYCHSRTWSVLL